MAREPLTIRVDAELLRILRAIADEESEPNISLVIRRALRQSPLIRERLQARRQAAPAGVVNVA